MNSITALHDAGPAHDELVPSRYAMRVGEIEVLVVSDGILPLSPATLATNVDPAKLAGWLNDRLLPQDVFKWALNAVVIRSGDRTILVDAGIGAEYPDFKAGFLAARLEAAGITPESITDVVLTHMHFDHIGGLLTDELGGRLRPGVPIHVAGAELAFWATPDFSRTAMPPSVQAGIMSAITRFMDKFGPQLQSFDQECEVAPGVVVTRTGGHTPGHSVVRVASGDDRLTFIGDALFPDHFDHPDWYNAFDHDPEEAVRVRVAIMRKLAATGEPMVATHLSFPSLGRVAVDGDAFRWIPAYWEY